MSRSWKGRDLESPDCVAVSGALAALGGVDVLVRSQGRHHDEYVGVNICGIAW